MNKEAFDQGFNNTLQLYKQANEIPPELTAVSAGAGAGLGGTAGTVLGAGAGLGLGGLYGLFDDTKDSKGQPQRFTNVIRNMALGGGLGAGLGSLGGMATGGAIGSQLPHVIDEAKKVLEKTIARKFNGNQN
jgi:hypothetical protein